MKKIFIEETLKHHGDTIKTKVEGKLDKIQKQTENLIEERTKKAQELINNN